jgi:hypothetical protein
MIQYTDVIAYDDPDIIRAHAAIASVDRLLLDAYWERANQPHTFIYLWVHAYIDACRRFGALFLGERPGRCGIHGPYRETTVCPSCALFYS